MILVELECVCWFALINIIETVLHEDAWEYVLKAHSSIVTLQTVRLNALQVTMGITRLEVASISVHHLHMEILSHFCAFLDAPSVIMLITLLKTVFQLSTAMVTLSGILQPTSV